MNLFKWINELFVGKRDWDSFSDADRKSFSPFMVIRYLSMSEDFLPLVNHMQNYVIEDMPHKAVYQFWCGILPKKKTYLNNIIIAVAVPIFPSGLWILLCWTSNSNPT